MKKNTLEFEARSLDAFFVRWLQDGLSVAELDEWKRILSVQHEVRERFCDWIIALRRSPVALSLPAALKKDH